MQARTKERNRDAGIKISNDGVDRSESRFVIDLLPRKFSLVTTLANSLRPTSCTDRCRGNWPSMDGDTTSRMS